MGLSPETWRRVILPWRWKHHVYQKRRYISNRLHGITVHMVAYLIEALYYKPEGHGFESWWGELFQLT
jgi:hypothetical protein